MRVLHVLASGSVNWGGPPIAVRTLVRGLGRLGVNNSVVTLDERPFPRFQFPESVRVHYCGNAIIPRLGMPTDGRIFRVLGLEIRDADVIHLHELWHVPQLAASILSKIARKPYVVSPHGAVEPFLETRTMAK